jgi:nucleoredoxin
MEDIIGKSFLAVIRVGKSVRMGPHTVEVESLLASGAEFIAIYFGAHWAPPCRLFTPALSDFYDKVNSLAQPLDKGQRKIEIVFCSIDGNEAAFERNYGEMPFAAIPYTDEQRIQNLKQRFGINGIPTLVVLDRRGEMVSFEGRTDIQNH